jgi:preprotein translocase subunit SecG
METVIIVIHLMVIVALIAVVLLQRSEGGALGIGGSNAFLSGRSQGNVLTRATTILGIAFFVTSIAMTVYGQLQQAPSSILENVPEAAAPPPSAPAGAPGAPAGNAGGILNQLNEQSPAVNPLAPVPTEPAPAGVPAAGGQTAPPASGAATPAPQTPAPAEPQVPVQQ